MVLTGAKSGSSLPDSQRDRAQARHPTPCSLPMIITPKEPRDKNAASSLSKLVPYMLRGKGEERCTWYMAGNLEGLDRREDAELAVDGR